MTGPFMPSSSSAPAASALEPDRLPKTDLLWLGAHKTGTTSLQHLLSQARSLLTESGLFYIDTQALRTRYTRPVLDVPARHRESQSLPPLPRGETHYLLFDENIPGLVQDAAHPTGLYPEAAERALTLSTRMGLHAPTLVFGLRGFADYLPSLYCERLKSLPFCDFRSFWHGRQNTLSWYDLVARLLAAFPQSHLLIYRAEDLRGREQALLSWITGIPTERWPKGLEQLREGFSQAAVDWLGGLARRRLPGPLDVFEATQRFPRRSQQEVFQPWSAAERKALARIYQADLASLRALARQSPRLHIWSPEADPAKAQNKT